MKSLEVLRYLAFPRPQLTSSDKGIKRRKSHLIEFVNPRAIPTEKRDCTVRALSIVANLPYMEAHRLLSMWGRPDGKGMPRDASWEMLIGEQDPEHTTGTLYGKWYIVFCDAYNRKWIGTRKNKSIKSCTLATFAECNPVGRFYILVHRHAVAVVDGKVLDGHNSLGQIVQEVFKFIKIKP